MRTKPWLLWMLAMLVLISLAAGCSAKSSGAPAPSAGSQLANPWKDATPDDAAKTLGGTFYNLTTLDPSYKQYALLVTTDDAVKGGSLPTAWVRFQKGDEDVSLQMFKGGKLSSEQLKGTQATVLGAPAYILQNADGTSEISWVAGGILFTIGTSKTWANDALEALAAGVKAQ